MDITGRKLFVKALQEEGVDTIFGYPGGTVTDLFDELYKQDSIDVVLPRHEQGLIHAAEGYAKSTGKVGVCIMAVTHARCLWRLLAVFRCNARIHTDLSQDLR